MDPVDLEVAPTSDGLLSFEVVGGSAERVEFLMTYEDAACSARRTIVGETNLAPVLEPVAQPPSPSGRASAFKPASTIVGGRVD